MVAVAVCGGGSSGGNGGGTVLAHRVVFRLLDHGGHAAGRMQEVVVGLHWRRSCRTD